MTIFILVFAFSFIVSPTFAYARSRGYLKNNGSYVNPYFRTSPNSYKWDNWSSKGNVNPFNGRKGYKSWY